MIPAAAGPTAARLAATCSACVNLAPPYERSAAPIAAAWPAGAPTQGPAAAGVGWAEFYPDPMLRQLITLALADNRDLRATALAVERARAQGRIVDAAALPNIGLSGAATAQRAAGQTTRQYSAQLGISAFELDFFGRVRNLRDQALESFLASEEALRAARIALVAEVATTYVTLAADRQRLRLAQDTLASQQKSFELTRRTYQIGSASGLDVAQAQTSVESARADIATFRTQVAQDLNALELLIGRPLDPALVEAAGSAADGTLTPLPTQIGTGIPLPSQLLQRRPDVLAAERTLRAAYADIGAARAARFPSISLTTSAGTASNELSRLFAAGTRTWTFVPALAVSIFDAGAGAANVRLAEVQRDAALAAYEQTLQVAFREVADALAQRREIDELLAARRALVTASERSYNLSEARYRRGLDSSLTALDAQRTLYSAQQNLITARLVEVTNLVTLYRVLGGGWREKTRGN